MLFVTWVKSKNMYKTFVWVWSYGPEFSFLTPPPPFWRGWKVESLDFRNFSFVYVPNSTSRWNFMMLEWLKYPIGFDDLSVSEWVNPKLAIFSGPYLQLHLRYISEIWYSPQDGLHHYICIISALYLKCVPSCSVVEIGSK